jgi:excisionase family DNA binding protein
MISGSLPGSLAARKRRPATPKVPLPCGIEPEFITIPETCAVTGLGRTMIFALIASGVLESIKIGRARRVRLASARALGRAA